MALSLNVKFEGTSPPDPEDPHPPGAGIARALEAALRARGFAVDPADIWRDSGWVLGCGQGQDALDVALAPTGPRQWMCQVGPRHAPESSHRSLAANFAAAMSRSTTSREPSPPH